MNRDWQVHSDISAACAGAACVVVAVPSSAFRDVARYLQSLNCLIVSATKGIEYQSGLSMCGILAQEAPAARLAALSGPSLALEVLRGVPSAVVAASEHETTAREVQALFHKPSFRVYTSTDLTGVEFGGALKNVIAIAAGICDGLGFGDNSKAALVTRAIVEMRRLGVACGAEAETFSGLSGLGDLTVTCFSRLSRNRLFGERFGRGEKPSEITGSMAVVEGVPTAKSAYFLARQRGIDVPIMSQVYAMLYEGKNVSDAIRDLTARDSKSEG